MLSVPGDQRRLVRQRRAAGGRRDRSGFHDAVRQAPHARATTSPVSCVRSCSAAVVAAACFLPGAWRKGISRRLDPSQQASGACADHARSDNRSKPFADHSNPISAGFSRCGKWGSVAGTAAIGDPAVPVQRGCSPEHRRARFVTSTDFPHRLAALATQQFAVFLAARWRR